jgi:hypothetical protein
VQTSESVSGTRYSIVLIPCRTLPIVRDMYDVAGVASFLSSSEYLPFGTRRSCHCARIETCQELMTYWLSFTTVKWHIGDQRASLPGRFTPEERGAGIQMCGRLDGLQSWSGHIGEENSFPVRESKHDLILMVVSAVLIDKKNKGTRHHDYCNPAKHLV